MNPKLWAPEFSEDPFFIEKAADELVSQLNKTKKSFKIFAGEVYWAIYDHPRVLNAFNEKSDKIDIEVIAGPVLSRGGSKDSPKIIKMVNNSKVKLFFREKRGKENHFRIIDDVEVVVQKAHPTLTPLHCRNSEGKYDVRSGSGKEYVGKYIKLFEKYKKDKVPSKDPDKDFLCFQSSELHKIVELVNASGKDYDNLSKDEISEYWKQVQEGKKEQLKKYEIALRKIQEYKF